MKTQEKGFYLPLGRSRYLLSYSLLAHMLAVISILLLSVSSVVKILFITGIFINQFFISVAWVISENIRNGQSH